MESLLESIKDAGLVLTPVTVDKNIKYIASRDDDNTTWEVQLAKCPSWFDLTRQSSKTLIDIFVDYEKILTPIKASDIFKLFIQYLGPSYKVCIIMSLESYYSLGVKFKIIFAKNVAVSFTYYHSSKSLSKELPYFEHNTLYCRCIFDLTLSYFNSRTGYDVYRYFNSLTYKTDIMNYESIPEYISQKIPKCFIDKFGHYLDEYSVKKPVMEKISILLKRYSDNHDVNFYLINKYFNIHIHQQVYRVSFLQNVVHFISTQFNVTLPAISMDTNENFKRIVDIVKQRDPSQVKEDFIIAGGTRTKAVYRSPSELLQLQMQSNTSDF